MGEGDCGFLFEVAFAFRWCSAWFSICKPIAVFEYFLSETGAVVEGLNQGLTTEY